MKKTILKNAVFAALIVAGLSFTSCKDNRGSETEGTQDATEANGDTYGSESSMDNENSGSTEGTDMGAGPASDTIQGTTTNGNSTAPAE